MHKEIIIIIVIIGLVVTANILTQRYTENCIDTVNTELEKLKEDIIKEEYEKILDNISKIETTWDGIKNKLEYYKEHNELEKVSSQIAEIKGNSEIKNIKDTVHQIENCKFQLQHIKEKEVFNFKNIF